MKRINLILSAMLILTFTGSVLALKANKSLNELIYLCPEADGLKTTAVEATITSSNFPGSAQAWATTTFDGTCAATWTIPRP